MPIGLTDEHEALRVAVRRFVETRIPPAVPRAALDADTEKRPSSGTRSAEPGWLGLHVDEAYGGAGYGLVEQAVVIEELGRAGAPGPYVPDRDRRGRVAGGQRSRGGPVVGAARVAVRPSAPWPSRAPNPSSAERSRT